VEIDALSIVSMVVALTIVMIASPALISTVGVMSCVSAMAAMKTDTLTTAMSVKMAAA